MNRSVTWPPRRFLHMGWKGAIMIERGKDRFREKGGGIHLLLPASGDTKRGNDVKE
ncbi:hypothetical protein SLEP1_g4461 [Rubroshorea leprosula]|uniref:Uncharacterized protein n=1 Tax=Rubroshorea leprosula TaxID=152421 RepID=A0AAV5HYI9_9ROSI|nr:hypothetical protein SLEP1_g4461 [Rubroshorea leprosula]